MVCCAYYDLLAQQFFMLQKVKATSTFCSTNIWAQEGGNTRNKSFQLATQHCCATSLTKIVARITRLLVRQQPILDISEENQNLWDVRAEACAVDWGVIMSIIRGIDTRDHVTCTWKGISSSQPRSQGRTLGTRLGSFSRKEGCRGRIRGIDTRDHVTCTWKGISSSQPRSQGRTLGTRLPSSRVLASLRNRTAGRLRTAEWRKNVARDCAFSILGPIYTVRFCRMRQRLTTGPRHDIRLLCTSAKMS